MIGCFVLRALIGGGGGTGRCDLVGARDCRRGFCGVPLITLSALGGVYCLGRFGCRCFYGCNFCGGCDVGSLAPTANRLTGWCDLSYGGGRRFGGDGGGGTTTSARGRGRRRLLLRAIALFALPSGAHAGDLIIRQRAQMAAHGNVHLTK